MTSATYMKKLICSNLIGTILEWYDFTIYAYLASSLSLIFFPHEKRYISLMLAYSVFALSFLIRPLGAILFGHLGDKVGRKNALIISIISMSIPTFMIGLLPAYNLIGVMSPILLIILRLMQGLSAGGEVIGSAIMVFESTTRNRGFYSSIIWAASGVGILFGSLVVVVLSSLFGGEKMASYGWRIPFLLGIFVGIIGLYLRVKTHESAEFALTRSKNLIATVPLIFLIRNFKIKMIKIVGLYALCASTIYVVYVYLPIYAENYLNIALSSAIKINSITMTVMVFLVPVFGFMSDRFNSKRFLILSSACFVIFSYPIFILVINKGLYGLFFGQLLFSILTACYHGPITASVLKILPVAVRYTGVGIGYNLSYSIFGGLAPLVSTYFIHVTGSFYSPAIYLVVSALISFSVIVVNFVNESK